MSELLICINLHESVQKNTFIFETYITHKIRKLKSKQFSGQRKKIDINKLNSIDNLSPSIFADLKKVLHRNNNIQIDYYRFLVANQNIIYFNSYITYGCLFYQDKEKRIYNIDDLNIKQVKILPIENQTIAYSGNKEHLYLEVIFSNRYVKNITIVANFYINLDAKNYKAELFFEYGRQEVSYTDKTRRLNETVSRDYFFEKNIIYCLESNGWHLRNTGFFEYSGDNLTESVSNLQKYGLTLYTAREKKNISVGNFSGMNISYNMDWFELSGELELDEKKIPFQDIINLTQKTKQWINLDGNVVFLPEVLLHHKNIFHQDKNHIKVEKKYIGQILALSQSMGIHNIRDIGELTDFSKIATHINTRLYPILKDYQKIGVQWLLYLYKNSFGGCLCDDMGLGKTIQIIAYLSDMSFEKSCNLIVVPKTLIENWKREIIKFLPDMKFYIYHDSNRDIETAKQNKVILTTYTMVTNDFEKLSKIEYTNVIIDEAQNIKNSKTKSYKHIANLNSKIKIILTGTPFENNIYELLALMHLINPAVFLHVKKSILHSKDGSKIVNYVKNIISPFVLRRVKTDVLRELPLKTEQTIYCTMDEAQKSLYTNMLRSIQYELKRKASRFEIKSNSIMLEGLLHLQQICCHPKLLPRELNKKGCLESTKTEVLISMLKSLVAAKHKVVVFSRFTSMLKIIENLLIKNNIIYFYLDGKTIHRLAVVDAFEHSDNSVFLVSLKAGGVGLNLTSADTVFIYDPWWNPAVEQQAEDRIYRMGQKQNVTIYRMITVDTIEEKIEQLKNKKKEMANQILDAEDAVTDIDMKILQNLILEKI